MPDSKAKKMKKKFFFLSSFVICCCSVSQLSLTLWPLGLQHARLPCPSPSPRTCSDSCPLSRLCHPTISSSVIPFSCLQSFPASGFFQWVFSHQVGKVLELQPQHQSFQWGLISFRIDWFDLSAVQGTLKSLLQHHNSKALKSILWWSVFFIVQLSHPYMTTGKTIALTRWTFVSKVMSLLFNMPSRLVIAFLLQGKRLLIHGCSYPPQLSWKNKENKVCHCFHFPNLFAMKWWNWIPWSWF